MNKRIFALILGLILFSGIAFAALSLVAYWTDNQNSALTIQDGDDAEFYTHFFTTMTPVEYSVKLYEGSNLIYTFEDRIVNSYDYWNYYTVDENKYIDAGNYRVEIRAEDNGGSISFESLTLTVEEVEEECPDADNDNVCDDDEIPFISVIANANPSSGVEPLNVAFTCSAQGGNTPLTYRWTFGDGGTINVQNPSHTYVNDGYYTATCTAYDSDNDFMSDQVSINVVSSEVNQAPILEGIPDKSVNEDTTPVNNWIDLWQYAFDNEDTDSELSFSIQSQSNSGLISCNIISDRYVDCNTPSLNDNGYSDIVVKVTDTSGLSDTDTFRVTVTAINDAPVIEDIGDQTARVGSVFRLDVDASDVDNDNLYFRDNSPLFNINVNTGEIEFTPSSNDVGTYNVQVCARDSYDFVADNGHPGTGTEEDCDTFELTIRSRIGDDDDDEEELRTEVTRTNCVDDGDGDRFGIYTEFIRTFEDDRFIREDVNERSCLLTAEGEGFIVNKHGREDDEEEKQDLFVIVITALIFVVVMLLLIVLIHRLFTKRY